MFPVFHEALGSILEVFHEGFGARLDPLGARAGTGWAGGVTRSAKNLCKACVYICNPQQGSRA